MSRHATHDSFSSTLQAPTRCRPCPAMNRCANLPIKGAASDDKSYMDVSSIALQGLQQAQTQLETTAQQLSTAGSSSNGAPMDTADLSDAAISLMSAKNQFAANLNLMKIADQMQKHVIDLLG